MGWQPTEGGGELAKGTSDHDPGDGACTPGLHGGQKTGIETAVDVAGECKLQKAAQEEKVRGSLSSAIWFADSSWWRPGLGAHVKKVQMQTQQEVEHSVLPALPYFKCGTAGRMCRPQEAAHM